MSKILFWNTLFFIDIIFIINNFYNEKFNNYSYKNTITIIVKQFSFVSID